MKSSRQESRKSERSCSAPSTNSCSVGERSLSPIPANRAAYCTPTMSRSRRASASSVSMSQPRKCSPVCQKSASTFASISFSSASVSTTPCSGGPDAQDSLITNLPLPVTFRYRGLNIAEAVVPGVLVPADRAFAEPDEVHLHLPPVLLDAPWSRVVNCPFHPHLLSFPAMHRRQPVTFRPLPVTFR